jgi:methylated-DNA-protein-cysteine methyltransferase related protein
MDEQAVERVRAVIAAIPPGEVMSYGEVAVMAGLRSARQVGRILAEDGHDLPWHRVVRADGTPTPHLATEQTARLVAEGAHVVNGRVVPGRRRRPSAGSS